MHWQLNRIQYPIYNLGPGRRLGIWVQGCSIHCPGCLSADLWPFEGGRAIDIAQLVNLLAQITEPFDGITITGGEPFDQYEALIAFCAFLKQKTGQEVFCFSGYYLDELLDKFPDRLFLNYLDYLLDGRYIAEQHDNHNVRGSFNQRLYKFENGQANLQNDFFQSPKWSIAITPDQRIFMAGIPRRNDLNFIETELAKQGLNVRFE